MNQNQTEHITDLVAALAKAQGQMQPAVFNKANPHFRSKYADFASCMDACRKPLSDNGLAILQSCDTINEKLYLITMLAHISGQWIKSTYPIITSKPDSQGIGSAITYAKRYSLCALIGVVADDEAAAEDDGEATMGRGKEPPKPPIRLTEAVINAFVERHELSVNSSNPKSLYIKYVATEKGIPFDDVVYNCAANPKSFESGFHSWSKKNSVVED